MANPFLVLGGIAVGIVTAGFGILQVPGWIASAQDASAKNDIAQVTIAEAASLSILGTVTPTLDAINANAAIGVDVTTSNPTAILVHTTKAKSYAVVVVSASGDAFYRIDGGATVKISAVAGADNDAKLLAASATAQTALDAS